MITLYLHWLLLHCLHFISDCINIHREISREIFKVVHRDYNIQFLLILMSHMVMFSHSDLKISLQLSTIWNNCLIPSAVYIFHSTIYKYTRVMQSFHIDTSRHSSGILHPKERVPSLIRVTKLLMQLLILISKDISINSFAEIPI